MSKVQPIPAGYHTVTPYLTVEEAPQFIAFLAQVFGAKEKERHARPDGTIMHAEVLLGDSHLMISEACDQMGPMPSCLYVYTSDVDGTQRKAVEAGCTSVLDPCDMFWGDRFSQVRDRWGNIWNIATHVEDVTPDELERRAKAFAQQMAQG